jgi:hypothetical protein
LATSRRFNENQQMRRCGAPQIGLIIFRVFPCFSRAGEVMAKWSFRIGRGVAVAVTGWLAVSGASAIPNDLHAKIAKLGAQNSGQILALVTGLCQVAPAVTPAPSKDQIAHFLAKRRNQYSADPTYDADFARGKAGGEETTAQYISLHRTKPPTPDDGRPDQCKSLVADMNR